MPLYATENSTGQTVITPPWESQASARLLTQNCKSILVVQNESNPIVAQFHCYWEAATQKRYNKRKACFAPMSRKSFLLPTRSAAAFHSWVFFWFTTSGAHTHTVRGTHVHTHVCIVCTYVFTNVSIFVCIRMYILLCVHSLKGKWKSPTLVFLLADWNA